MLKLQCLTAIPWGPSQNYIIGEGLLYLRSTSIGTPLKPMGFVPLKGRKSDPSVCLPLIAYWGCFSLCALYFYSAFPGSLFFSTSNMSCLAWFLFFVWN